MTWRSVVVYWLLALVVGANLYSEWRAREPVGEVAEHPVAPIVDASASSIERIRARRGDVTIELERRGAKWTVVRPAGLDVSNDLVEALLDTLTTIPPVEILADAVASTDGAAPTAQFGLDPPLITLELMADAGPVARIDLGQRNPTRTAVYARLVDADRLYLLGLNAQYYVELIYEQLGKQTGGVPLG